MEAEDHPPLDQTVYDAVVVGTGLCESMVAAALSRAGKSVLHLDHRRYYGGENATLDLRSLIEMQDPAADSGETAFSSWSLLATVPVPQESIKEETPDVGAAPSTLEETAGEATAAEDRVEEEPVTVAEPTPPKPKTDSMEALLKNSRRYNLDLAPAFILANAKMVETLVQSGVHQYCEFKATEASYLLLENEIRKVPCSKNEIFADKSISLLEKRILMKFLQLCLAYAEADPEREESAELKRLRKKIGMPFRDFLKGEKLNESLQGFVLYAIAGCLEDQSVSGISTETGMNWVVRYLKSVGRFGQTAFLATNYGVGELPQGFCRLCAVHGGIYVLNRGVSNLSLESDEDGTVCRGVICDGGQAITAGALVCGASYLSDYCVEGKGISRCMAIVEGSLFDCDHATMSIPPSLEGGHSEPIQVIQYGPETWAAPEGHYVIHFFTTARGPTPESDLGPSVDALLSHGHHGSEGKPRLIWGAYYRQKTPTTDSAKLPKGIYVVPPARPSVCSTEEACEAARAIFIAICPGEAFLPRAPDPEESLQEMIDDQEYERVSGSQQASVPEDFVSEVEPQNDHSDHNTTQPEPEPEPEPPAAFEFEARFEATSTISAGGGPAAE